ncbi:MAG: GatB/YqeY domain-containing protein [Gemmatimonadota bacterium]
MPTPNDLAARLTLELNTARRAQDKTRTLLFGTVISAVKNREIEVDRGLSDDDVVEVIRKQIKTRRESVEQYTKAGRQDLADQEQAEIAVLEPLLPAAIDPAEIRQAVREVVAGGTRDLGKVMGLVMPKFKGKADGKVINQIVREELQAG